MLDRIAANNAATRQTASSLFEPRMHCFQTMQTLSEFRRQTFVSFDLIEEQGVAAGRGTIQQVEEGRAGGLSLIGDIRVPGDRVGVLLKKLSG